MTFHQRKKQLLHLQQYRENLVSFLPCAKLKNLYVLPTHLVISKRVFEINCLKPHRFFPVRFIATNLQGGITWSAIGSGSCRGRVCGGNLLKKILEVLELFWQEGKHARCLHRLEECLDIQKFCKQTVIATFSYSEFSLGLGPRNGFSIEKVILQFSTSLSNLISFFY